MTPGVIRGMKAEKERDKKGDKGREICCLEERGVEKGRKKW